MTDEWGKTLGQAFNALAVYDQAIQYLTEHRTAPYIDRVLFYLVTPPAQFGVDLMIRTGPGSTTDNFSQWIVTPRSKGGALPDGYRVKHAAVWSVDQLNEKGEPKPTELPLQMPTEHSFFKFLGMDWINPRDRHAKWGRR